MAVDFPLVSVIIPAYRRADFVNQAVASVMRQTFTDYEIIVVDDCSGDEVVDGYHLPPGAQLIRRETNSGRASIPRNDGFRASRGRYVAFLDMDDIWLPEKLAKQVAVLESHPEIGLTFCHYQRVNEALQPLRHQNRPPVLAADVLRQLLAGNILRSPSQALIRRTVLEEAGGFDPAIIGTADWDLWIRLARITAFHADAAPNVLYRRYAGQQSRDQRKMRHGGIVVLDKALEWVTGERPDLLPVVNRRLAHLHCRYAWSEMMMHGDRSLVKHSLLTALACDPLTWRVYLGFLRFGVHTLLGEGIAGSLRK